MVSSKTDYFKIVPYTKLKLDCYQNMIVTLLNFHNCNVEKLGARWPWKFRFRVLDGNKRKITNQYVTTDKALDELFGYKIKSEVFRDDNLLEQILIAISNKPIIVNVDQYFIPHHYKHIYQKEHGQHSLLLLGEDRNNNIICVDALPEYKGIIETEKLLTAMLNFSTDCFPMTYSYLNSCSSSKLKSCEEQYNDLIRELLELSNQSNIYKKDENLYLRDIYQMVETAYDCLELDKFIIWLQEFCAGSWLWEIDRSAKWFIAYLNTDYPVRLLGNMRLEKLVNLIEEANNAIVTAMRLYYKTILTKSQKCTLTANEKMKIALNREELILNLLLGR